MNPTGYAAPHTGGIQLETTISKIHAIHVLYVPSHFCFLMNLRVYFQSHFWYDFARANFTEQESFLSYMLPCRYGELGRHSLNTFFAPFVRGVSAFIEGCSLWFFSRAVRSSIKGSMIFIIIFVRLSVNATCTNQATPEFIHTLIN